MIFKAKTPCKDCPYRKDAPLAHWHREHFKDVLASDRTPFFGKVFGCHKNDDSICRGYLMDQVKRGEPNINLRLMFSKYRVTVAYRDSLHCSSELYDSIEDMAEANYPGITNPD